MHPEHRRSGAARGLIEMAKTLAPEAGMPFEINLSSPVTGNSTAQTIGAFGALAGGLGSLWG